MVRVVDATGREVSLPHSPKRVVSLVPSTTESVFDLGAGEKLVGVTRFCVRPDTARRSAVVLGGTKNPRLDAILRLAPDLILANQEENRAEDVQALRALAPVYVAFPRTVPEAIDEIFKLGVLLDREPDATRLASEVGAALQRLRERVKTLTPYRYLYLIWQSPYMAAGPGTFIDSLLRESGGQNAIDRERYPALTRPEVEALDPDVVFFSSEPFPFESSHVEAFFSACPRARGQPLRVDGQNLSWHGTRLREGLPYLERLLPQILALRAVRP